MSALGGAFGRRVLVTLGVVLVFRWGQALPLPGVDVAALARSEAGRSDQLHGLAALFTGGGLGRMSVLALGVVPGQVAEVVLLVLISVSPRLAALEREGRAGLGRLAQLTRVLTVGVGALLGALLVVAAAGGHVGPGAGVLPDRSGLILLALVVCLAGGTALVMRLGELITAHGVGSGPAVLFLAQVLAILPGQFGSLRESFGGPAFAAVLTLVVAVGVVVAAATVTVHRAERRVPVQRAKRLIARIPAGGTPTYLPLPLARTGLGPVVWLSLALFVLPALATRIWPGTGWLHAVAAALMPSSPWYLTGCLVLVFCFTFGSSIAGLDVVAVTDCLARQGQFVPGIRPGPNTADYLAHLQLRTALAGAVFVGTVTLLPLALPAVLGTADRHPFNGIGLLLVAGLGGSVAARITGQAEALRVDGP
ncbi:preprotein translocase subunit SecY [Kitasatospora sp. CMC57]|uniref:Preprotein translocase subunit SecY n=1 Tax=Kitasatospora sp. CMC57 TaxID=3231513 RepID=A0AB33JLX1_9ACTN